MSYNLDLGAKGEQIARKFLEDKGYQINETNWRNSHQEIDIIAVQNGRLIFVEVKSRSNTKFGYPEEAVTKKKQKRLAEAADMYLNKVNHEGEIRFDIISILFNNNETEIYHIEDAFFPQLED